MSGRVRLLLGQSPGPCDPSEKALGSSPNERRLLGDELLERVSSMIEQRSCSCRAQGLIVPVLRIRCAEFRQSHIGDVFQAAGHSGCRVPA